MGSAPLISASVSGHFDEKFSTARFYAGFRLNGIYRESPVWVVKSIKNQMFLPSLSTAEEDKTTIPVPPVTTYLRPSIFPYPRTHVSGWVVTRPYGGL